MEDTLITVADLAEHLQVSESWVRQRVQAEEIPHLRVGRNIRFRTSDIRNYLAGKTVGGGA